MTTNAAAQMLVSSQIETPHSPIGEEILAAGWIERIPDKDPVRHTKVIIHEYSGVEEEIMGSDKVPAHHKLTLVLASTLRQVGPYTNPDIRPRVANELVNTDRIQVLLKCRRLAFGDIYPYEIKCSNLRCKKPDLHMLAIESLRVKSMPKPDQRSYECKVRGLNFVWHPMTGADQERAEEQDVDKLTRLIFARLDTVEGKPPTVMQVKQFGGAIRDGLRAEFEEHEGGVENDVTSTCQFCGSETTVDLDLTQPGFFSPALTLKRWKKRSSG